MHQSHTPNVYLLLYGAALVNNSETAFKFAVKHLDGSLAERKLPSSYANALKQTDL